MTFNQIDMYILAGAAVFFVIGVRTGFLRAALSVLGVYASFFVAQSMAPAMIRSMAFLSVEETKPGMLTLTLIIFGLSFLIIEFVLVLLKSVITISLFGPVDKVLGGLISIFKVFLVAGMAIESMYILPLTEEQQHFINQSFFKDWAVQCYKKTFPMALSAAKNTSEYISSKVSPQVKETAQGAVTTVAAITAEAVKLRSTLDALPKY